jgi:hypothetical protein
MGENGNGPPTIGRDDRDLLVDLMAYRYFVTSDLRIMRELDHGVGDEESATRFRDDLALMSDLGWLPRWCLGQLGLPESEKEEFEIWLPPDRLRAAVGRALADAREAVAAGASPLEGSPADLFDRAVQACEALLADIDRTEESR